MSKTGNGESDQPARYHRLAALSDELVRLNQEHERTIDEMHRVVSEMRSVGATWAVIGSILGTSYQTAQKRFSREGVRRRWRKRSEQEP